MSEVPLYGVLPFPRMKWHELSPAFRVGCSCWAFRVGCVAPPPRAAAPPDKMRRIQKSTISKVDDFSKN